MIYRRPMKNHKPENKIIKVVYYDGKRNSCERYDLYYKCTGKGAYGWVNMATFSFERMPNEKYSRYVSFELVELLCTYAAMGYKIFLEKP